MSPPAAAAKAMFSDDESGSGSGSDSDSGSEDSGSSSGSDETAKRVSSKAGNVVGKETDVLTINKKFAERFEHNKRREETHRLQEKVKREYILRPGDVGEGSDSETSSSESDEGDVPAKFDAQFAEALLKIKTKDPAIYREDAELFSSDDGDDDDDAKVKKKRERPRNRRYARSPRVSCSKAARRRTNRKTPRRRRGDAKPPVDPTSRSRRT